jgi:hypothetical protein
MMQGFKPVVQACAMNTPNRLPFERFREDYTTYHILLGNREADTDAIAQAKALDYELTKKYLAIEKPRLGYGDDPNVPFREMDFCDSHHIMMSVIIAHFKKNYDTIVEIGAGYGNMIRLNQDILNYAEWIDIDLPFVLDLADWYLDQTIKDRNKIKLVSALNFPEMKPDLVIGAHSLSELSMDDFMEYYKKIILNSRYFFYATHINNCGFELIQAKLKLIKADFEALHEVVSEGGGVFNTLYERKT